MTYPSAVGSRPRANPTQPAASRTRSPLFNPQTLDNMGVEHPGAGETALARPLLPTLHDLPQRSWVATPGQTDPTRR